MEIYFTTLLRNILWLSDWSKNLNYQLQHLRARSIILTTMAAMAGGTQLFEGAHLVICAFVANQANVAILHFCCEFSFVAIMHFLKGTFGQNLVMGGTKTFQWTGPMCNVHLKKFPLLLHHRFCKFEIKASTIVGVQSNASDDAAPVWPDLSAPSAPYPPLRWSVKPRPPTRKHLWGGGGGKIFLEQICNHLA